MWIDPSTHFEYRVQTIRTKGSHMATTKGAPKAKPPKRVDRRKTTSTRITPETRARLDEAAVQSGRSLAQEMEFRLEQSFLGDEFLGGPENATAAKLVGPILQDVEARTGRSWREDKNTYYGAVAAVLAIMRVLGPRDVPQPKMAFDEDADADEHIIFGSIDAAVKIAAGKKSQRK